MLAIPRAVLPIPRVSFLDLQNTHAKADQPLSAILELSQGHVGEP